MLFRLRRQRLPERPSGACHRGGSTTPRKVWPVPAPQPQHHHPVLPALPASSTLPNIPTMPSSLPALRLKSVSFLSPLIYFFFSYVYWSFGADCCRNGQSMRQFRWFILDSGRLAVFIVFQSAFFVFYVGTNWLFNLLWTLRRSSTRSMLFGDVVECGFIVTPALDLLI